MSAPDTAYFFDGVPLDDADGRWFVDSASESAPTPGLVLRSVQASGLDGDIFVPNDPYDVGLMGLTMNVTDIDHNFGAKPSYAALYRNWDALKALLLPRHELHVLGRMQGGEYRETGARIAASSIPRELDSRTLQVKFLVDLPLPLWRDGSGAAWAGSVVEDEATLTVSPLTGATARCGDGELRVAGPFTEVGLTDVTTGQWLSLKRTVPAGSVFALDLSDLTGRVGSADVTGLIDVGPGGFSLTPNGLGVTQVRVSREGGAGLVSGVNLKRSFL